MKFNSQICTTKEQSERLLALGLKKETADMKYPCTTEYYSGVLTEGLSSLPMIINTEDDEVTEYDLPAWSLHRLMCLLPTEYIADIDFQQVMQDFVFRSQNMYDEVICCIETLIKEGYFYEEYLED